MLTTIICSAMVKQKIISLTLMHTYTHTSTHTKIANPVIYGDFLKPFSNL